MAASPMPAPLADIVRELDRLLQPERFQDYCPNGLQVPGAETVTTVATGVSANVELFERARAQDAELILVHHGLFWASSTPTAIDAALKRRLKLLFDADVNLAAYHLPLDAHLEVGNNALLARALGADSLEPFALHRGQAIGCIAHFPGGMGDEQRGLPHEHDEPPSAHGEPPLAHGEPPAHGEAPREQDEPPPEQAGLPAQTLFARVHEVTGRAPLVFDSGPAQVRRLAVVSGAGANYLADAIAAGADAFLTGEPAERVMSHAREAGIHFIAAGHYATETFGVRRLGEHLSERFGVRHVFIDVPNPV
jgi:dinuclear metal center YbgI/SA1388 family protein